MLAGRIRSLRFCCAARGLSRRWSSIQSCGVTFESLIPALFIGLFVLMAALAITSGIRGQKRARESLLRLAETMRLGLVEGPSKPFSGRPVPALAGNFRGREVRIHGYSTGSGKSRTHWIAISSPVRNAGGLSLRLSAENLFTRAGRKIGIQDVDVGDPEFDAKFCLKTNDAAYVRAALIPEVRRRAIEAWKTGAHGTISVEASEVKYAETGSFSRRQVVERFPALAEVVCDFGEIVDARD